MGKDTYKTGAFKYTYRCALFRIFCRQQCKIYMHMLVYTQKRRKDVYASVCTL